MGFASNASGKPRSRFVDIATNQKRIFLLVHVQAALNSSDAKYASVNNGDTNSLTIYARLVREERRKRYKKKSPAKNAGSRRLSSIMAYVRSATTL